MLTVAAAVLRRFGYGIRSVPATLRLWLLPVHAGNMMAKLIIFDRRYSKLVGSICATAC